MDQVAQLFVSHSANKLRQVCGDIGTCLERLDEDQIWSRGASHENSIGNLVLHLCGNVRQWIGAGVGGEQDIRDRPKEFSEQGGLTGAELRLKLNQTVEHAAGIIEAVSPARLLEEIEPQNGRVSVLQAIYQVVGHFQQHAGQIIFATKICTGQDLGIYKPRPYSTQ